MLDTMEKFYIYKETRINNQIYDKCTVKPNVIFETLILVDTDRAHITLYQPAISAHTSDTISDHTQTHTSKRPANLNRKYTHIPIIYFITRLLHSTSHH